MSISPVSPFFTNKMKIKAIISVKDENGKIIEYVRESAMVPIIKDPVTAAKVEKP